MQLQILRSLEDLEKISSEWNDLLACCSASHVPFLRHEYLVTWWKTLGGGEWPRGDLFTIIAHDNAGELLGIAPLFFAPNRQSESALLLLGSIEISDYLDIIGSTDTLPSFVDELLELCDSEQAPAWKVLDWYNIPEESPTLPALQAAAERRGWSYTQERLQPCPYIPLPGDWDTYLAGIDKKQRHEIRRKLRRAEEANANIRWYIVQEEEELDAEIDAFLTLMAHDPEKDRFLTAVMRSQMRQAVHVAFQGGWLQLAFLEVSGQKAAGYLNFDYAGHIWVYNSGLNFAYREYSPGWVLLGYLLQWANQNGRRAFDFMRGDEEYKYRFGAINRYVCRATVRRT